MAERIIRRITQTIPSLPQINKQVKQRKVAAYARVSTSSAEQENSLAAQRDYFYKLIQRHDDWCFVEVYYDDGISGLSSRRRDGFNRMLDDAKVGKIDLILTKSLSRFARNTVDSLIAIRTLKSLGVEVYFEKEDIFTFDAKGEFLITLMSSLAQEESRSLSENVTWGHRKRFADGKYYVPYARFIGYDRGSDGIPVINPHQEPIIRLIFRLYLLGESEKAIRKYLESHNDSLGAANTSRWHESRVMDILQNEKYKGDALLQKAFTVDFLTKKMKKNEGEVPQYYVENSHPAIVSPEEWKAVQDELERRKVLGRKYSGTSVFASRLVCADCGEFFGAKTWHSNDKYRKTIWRCTHKYNGENRCGTPNLNEETIKERFMEAVNSLISDKDAVLEDCRIMRDVASNCTEIDAELTALMQEIEVVTELTRRCIDENSRTAQDQTEFEARYNGFVVRYEKASKRVMELQALRREKEKAADDIGDFMFDINELNEPIQQFDNGLWLSLVERVLVHKDGKMTFQFIGGFETIV